MRSNVLYSALGVLLLVFALHGAALAITVTVNDQPLPAYPPAVERNGRVLLPMRTVFEALGASVHWQAATQTVTATRGDQTVQMTIGQPAAFVGTERVILDVPPRLISGVTYVPVRFPAEALGADVRWLAPQQQVAITLAQAPVAPVPPPTPVGGVATGMVTSVSPGQITLRVGSRIESYAITPDTQVLLRGQPVQVRRLALGAPVRVEYDARGLATLVQANYVTVTGTVRSLRGRQLVLDTYSAPLQVPADVVITSPTGTSLRLRDVSVGDRVVVHVTPDTNQAFQIALGAEGQPGQALTVTHNATGALVPGQVIRVSVTGPTNSVASFDLGTWQRNLPLQEVRPGVYEGSFVIPPVNAPRREPVIVYLRTRQGVRLQATAVTPLRIVLRPGSQAGLTVLSPVAGSRVGDRVVVEGYAEPLSDVVVTITYRGRAPGSVEETGQLVRTTVTADETGYFRTGQIALRPPSDISQSSLRYSLSVASVSAGGVLSPPLQVAFNP